MFDLHYFYNFSGVAAFVVCDRKLIIFGVWTVSVWTENLGLLRHRLGLLQIKIIDD